ASWIKNAIRRGATLILADPRETPLARFARWHLAFRPDTDVALLTAMLQVILAEGLVDRAFIEARVAGLDQLARSVAEATPERMAPICGIAPETIRAVARCYATAERAMILWGMGISQHVHGTDNARCLIALALLTGQIGRPGTGLHPLRGQNNVQGASDAGLIPMMLPGYARVDRAAARAAFEAAWALPAGSLGPLPGLTVVEITQAIEAGMIEALYVMGENPAMSDPDLGHTRAALAKLGHLVVQDLFPTETALLADVLLPASAHYEKWGTSTNTDRLIQLGRPAFDPPGEARQDLWLIEQIGRRLGLDWRYWQDADGVGRAAAQAPVARVYEEMRQMMPTLAGVPWSRLVREGAVQTPCTDAHAPGESTLFAERFATADGRGQLQPLAYRPGPEQPDPDYPFVLATGRLLEHWHTGAMTRRARVLDQLAAEAEIAIHPADADALGLAEGAPVTVATRHGQVTARCRRSPQLQRGQLFLPFAYWEAAANQLTGSALDPAGKIPGFKVTAARIETRA
ncbi:MAG: molybdopterin oxidoreductase family protein, partial [Casimicrobiaceae bacterium]